MKKYALPMLLLFLTFACNTSTDKNQEEPLVAQTLLNISYGNDSEQIADIYLPAGRNENTKTIILVHGGGWSGGSKADMSYFIPTLQSQFPDYAIVNTDYRLATSESPGFPKQIEDLQKLIVNLKNGDYHISNDFAMIGTSAGAHLSMLYAYNYDPSNEVKALCSIVGPTDFTDPAYTGNPLFQSGLFYLVGNVNPQTNPEIFIDVSPVTHVSAQSPPTILLYGGQDPLIPASQAPRLKDRLDDFNVYNEMYIYAEGGHGNWDAATTLDFTGKLFTFLESKF